MAEKVEIVVHVKLDGTVEVTTHGLKGADCVTETKDLEKALGKVKKREKTREAFEKAKAMLKGTVGKK